MNKIGLVGFGRFGQLLYKHFREQIEIGLYDPYQQEKPGFRNLPFVNLTRLTDFPFLILAVPVSSIDLVAQEIAPRLKKGTLVMDVCAVKKYPLRILEQHLPEEVEILGSHPLFGPDSAGDSLQGHVVILTPTRIGKSRLQQVREFWKNQGVRVVEMTPEEQDRLMAWTLALTHFLGRGLARLPLPDSLITTRDFQNLLQLVKKVNNDTVELFQDMHRFNPYTAEMREMLLNSLEILKEELDQIQVKTSE